jgi:hypothetical protein
VKFEVLAALEPALPEGRSANAPLARRNFDAANIALD